MRTVVSKQPELVLSEARPTITLTVALVTAVQPLTTGGYPRILHLAVERALLGGDSFCSLFV